MPEGFEAGGDGTPLPIGLLGLWVFRSFELRTARRAVPPEADRLLLEQPKI